MEVTGAGGTQRLCVGGRELATLDLGELRTDHVTVAGVHVTAHVVAHAAARPDVGCEGSRGRTCMERPLLIGAHVPWNPRPLVGARCRRGDDNDRFGRAR